MSLAIVFSLLTANGYCTAFPTSSEALQKLLEGNHRFASGKLLHPDQTLSRVRQTSSEQHPIAAILGCSDSRVSPEIIFDQGLGDLFVVRDAGNIVDDDVLGSLEYAVVHLKVPLIMVLGHEKCGAVDAALKHATEGHVAAIVKKIESGLSNKNPQTAVEFNVRHSMGEIFESHPILSEAIHKKQLIVVGGIYDIDTGRISILDSSGKELSLGPSHR